MLREKLRPDYRAACKRLVMSPDFYDAIQRPNAQLVTEAIERVEQSGVRTRDGRLHELDVLVLATGFRVDRFVRPMQVIGRGGVALDDVWKDGPFAYLAISVPDFPNFFMLNGPNGPVGNFSLIEVAELQFAYILQLDRAGAIAARATRSARVAGGDGALRRRAPARPREATIWASGCKSWYLDADGLPTAWPWTFDRFREEMARAAPRRLRDAMSALRIATRCGRCRSRGTARRATPAYATPSPRASTSGELGELRRHGRRRAGGRSLGRSPRSARRLAWERDTLVNLWSTTKMAAALCVLVLHDRRALSLDAPIAAYWPEFGAAGKADVRVRHVLGHTAGLPVFDEPVDDVALFDWSACCSRLAAQPPRWKPGDGSGYHAETQGWLLGELVRRVDGRTLGAFLRDEVSRARRARPPPRPRRSPLRARRRRGDAARRPERSARSRTAQLAAQSSARSAALVNTGAWRRRSCPPRTRTATPARSRWRWRRSPMAGGWAIASCSRRRRSSAPSRCRRTASIA